MEARSHHGEPRVLINREALIDNARLIRRMVGPKVSICAVIKADGYGHGSKIIAEALCDNVLDEMATPAVNMLALATMDEALALDEPSLPLMILRPVENAYVGRQKQQIEHAIQNGWILTVCSGAAVDDIARIAMARNQRAYVQIMVDTGMSRSGVQEREFDALHARVRRHVSLRLFGFSTHFACSEAIADDFTARQFRSFCTLTDTAVADCRTNKLNVVRHCANSGAVFAWPQTHLDMVRPGLALYGIDPSCCYNPKLPLRPVMKWVAHILLIKEIAAGTSVGYGRTWYSQRATRLGLVPVGYADGFLRSWSNNSVMIVHGRPAPVVGRVSMDMTMLDVTDIPEVQPGDEVTIMDDNPESPASVYQLARKADTIPYEIMCRIGQRVHRVPAGEPKLQAVL